MLKKLLASVREFKRQTILTPIMMYMEVVMEVIIPIIMAKLIDEGINAGNMLQVIVCGVILAVDAVILSVDIYSGIDYIKIVVGLDTAVKVCIYRERACSANNKVIL